MKKISWTHRLVRVVMFPNSLGIGPVNRFPRSDLHFINRVSPIYIESIWAAMEICICTCWQVARLPIQEGWNHWDSFLRDHYNKKNDTSYHFYRCKFVISSIDSFGSCLHLLQKRKSHKLFGKRPLKIFSLQISVSNVKTKKFTKLTQENQIDFIKWKSRETNILVMWQMVPLTKEQSQVTRSFHLLMVDHSLPVDETSHGSAFKSILVFFNVVSATLKASPTKNFTHIDHITVQMTRIL